VALERFQLKWADWHPHPTDDFAVLPINDLDAQFKWHYIVDEREFLTEAIITTVGIGPGGDAFMVGRLVTAAGFQRHKPIVRFGNVSMMADAAEPMSNDDYGPQVSFLVECRSLSGFSGSRVFVSSSHAWPLEEIVAGFLDHRDQRHQMYNRPIGSTRRQIHGTSGDV
jgi:hypothetical protein